MRITVHIDIQNPLMKRKKFILGKHGCVYAWFRYERLPMFCFLRGRLGHAKRFCLARIIHGKKELAFEWHMSLKVVLKRVMITSSPWLRQKG